jgi:hypothetical protein
MRRESNKWNTNAIGRERFDNLKNRARTWRYSDPHITEPANVTAARKLVEKFGEKAEAKKETHRARVAKLVDEVTQKVLFSDDAKVALKAVEALEAQAKREKWVKR